MDNKRLGMIIFGIGIVFAVIVVVFSKESSGSGFCAASVEPARIFSHISIGVVFSTLSLGIYLLLFNKSEKEVMKLIGQQKDKELIENKFEILLLGLNGDEKKVITAVKEQDGISQHTLGIRAGLHKSKLSITVSLLEQKGLIKKEKKGKINYLHLKIAL